MTFYKVRKIGTNLFYSPPTLAFESGFDKEGKQYSNLDAAIRVKESQLFAPCEVVQYFQATVEMGVVSKRGKLKLALHQQIT